MIAYMTLQRDHCISTTCSSGNRVMTEQYNPTPFLHIELRGAENWFHRRKIYRAVPCGAVSCRA